MTFLRRAAAAALLALSVAGPTPAQTFSWNPTQSSGTNLGGTGTWANADTKWWNGTTNVALDSTRIGTFAGAAGGVVDVSGTVNAGGLTFSTTGYTLRDTFFVPGTVSLAAGATIRADAGVTATITSGITVATGGALNFSTGSSTSRIAIGLDVTHTGATTISGPGAVQLQGQTQLGSTTGIALNGGTLEFNAYSVAFNRAVTMANGTALQSVTTGSNSVFTNMSNLTIASGATVGIRSSTNSTNNLFNLGTGYNNAAGSTATPTINVGGTGFVGLESGNNSFRGNWVVQSGTLFVRSTGSTFGNPTVSGSLSGSTLRLDGGNMLFSSDAAFRFQGGTSSDLPVTVAANTTFAADRLSPGAGYSVTFGNLSIGTQTLTCAPGASNTSGTSSLVFNGSTTMTGNPTFSVNNVSGGAVAETTLGAINGGATARTITKQGTGTLVLGSAATALASGSVLDIEGGTLRLGVANVFGSTSTPGVRFDGGTLRSANGSGVGNTQGLGALAMTGADGTIALGSGSHTLTFTSAAFADAGSLLTITGWTGTVRDTGTAGRIVFTDTSGLNDIVLSQITFLDVNGISGNNLAATLNGNELVPVPEPAGVLFVAAVATAAVRRRRNRDVAPPR